MKITREDLIKQMESNGFRLAKRTHLPDVSVFPSLRPKVN
jgi:hypothetical protein